MDNLLVGCRLLYKVDGSEKEGIIVRMDRGRNQERVLWVMGYDGIMEGRVADEGRDNRIHPDDINFLKSLSSDYNFRREMIKNNYSRLDLMDIEQ